MKKNTLFSIFVLAAGLAAEPCHAAFPILQEYIDEKWVYYAPVADQALIFETGYRRDASNAWIAIERSPSNRRIMNRKTLKLTDFWTDRRGRLHSLSVLEAQIDFNSYLQEAEDAGKNHLGAGYLKVDETGVLDRQTLRIPWGKLYIRIDEVAKRLAAEHEAIASLVTADPSGAALKKKYASYLSEKVAEGMARLSELETAIAAAPCTMADQDVPVSPPSIIRLTGLRGLPVPVSSQYYLKEVEKSAGAVRFATVNPRLQSELLIGEFVDPMAFTPAVAADLKDKESIANKAIGLAESLCRDMLTPPCQ